MKKKKMSVLSIIIGPGAGAGKAKGKGMTCSKCGHEMGAHESMDDERKEETMDKGGQPKAMDKGRSTRPVDNGGQPKSYDSGKKNSKSSRLRALQEMMG